MKGGGKARRRKLAINRLRNRLQALIIEGLPVEGAIERFFARQDFPIVEGDRCTFAVRASDVEGVWLRHRVLGLPGTCRYAGLPAPICGTS